MIGDILLFTVNSVLPLIILIVLGYILKIKGFFSKDFLKTANKAVFYVFLPVLIFKNIADIEAISMVRLDVVAYVLCIIVILLVAGYITARFIRDPKQRGVIHQCIYRSNFALLGVPLSELIGGESGVRVAAIISMFSIPIFNIMGVVVLSVYNGDRVKVDYKKILKGIRTNPLIIAVVAGIAIAVIKNLFIGTVVIDAISSMSFINTTISYIARAATPLSLIVLGGQFEFSKVSGYRKQILIGVVGRNFFSPLLGIGLAGVLTLAGVLDFGPEVYAALIALFGTPVAVASAVMAEAMDNDGQLAGQLVVWTSLVSMASLFVVIALARAFGLL